MSKTSNKYPVVLFVYKRPESTLELLNRISIAGVSKVYIFADGPKSETDGAITDQVKSIIVKFATYHPDMELNSTFSPTNLGLKQNIIKGLNSVFSHESAAIILEDDCLPSPDFFIYAEEMILKYKDNSQVMSINGTSSGGDYKYSYDFTKYSQCWGWATWARAWKLYDPNMSKFDPLKWGDVSTKLKLSRIMSWYWKTMLTVVKAGRIDTWDFQWSFAHFINNALAISPSVNLVKNVGFDSVATNTKTKTSASSMNTASLNFPLVHPDQVIENLSVSSNIESKFYNNPVAILGLLRQYIYWKMSKI